MAEEKKEPVKIDPLNKDAAVKPDPETLGTTDPQEHMKGPLSSLMHKIEKGAEHNDAKDAKEQDEGK